MTDTKRILLLCTVGLMLVAVGGAQTPANLRGQVSDPSGAAVPKATVTVTGPNGVVKVAETNNNGVYSLIGLPPGMYTVRVGATGFTLFEKVEVDLAGGRATTLDARLSLASDRQEVTVTDSPQVELDPTKNASATVLTGSDLDSLSDDPVDLESDLMALAGPSAGPNGGQIFVDGFSNGQLPPKNSIREIRVNSNPFSAEFDRVGFGRVEILTKPGTDRLRGSASFEMDNAKLDSRNPYSTTKPSSMTRQIQANVGGSLSKKASFFLDFSNRRNDDQALVKATILDANFLPVPFSQNLASPDSRMSISPRIDYQLGTNHTLQARYTWNKSTSEGNTLGGFNLASQGTNGSGNNNSAQVTETWVVNTTTINESRFQYTRSNSTSTGISLAPTINVTGAFTGNAATTGQTYTLQNSFEFQNYSIMTRGSHLIKAGVRVRSTLESNRSDSNFNGTFRFASITAYAATVSGLAQGLTMAQINANGGGPIQYSITAGNPLTEVSQMDIAPFIQDDWRVKPSFTLSLGFRYEKQTNIGGVGNFAPRLGFAWGIGGGQGRLRQPKTVLRGGFGMFYDRFGLGQVLTAARLNGIAQQQYVVLNPQFYLNNIPSISQLGASQPVTTYQIDKGLVAPRIIQTAIGVDRQLPKNITLSLTYTRSQGLHQLRTRNINAPLPGTYAAGAPVYPFGTSRPVNEYESGGIFRQNQLTVNVNARLNARFSLFGYYNNGYASANTDGVGTFPANTYDFSNEWGRASFNTRHRFNLGGNVSAPFGIRLAPMINFSTASPFNITVGQDLNGDTQTNDRPSFASALSNPLYVVHTSYGDFNTKPVAGETIVPRNYGLGFGSFTVNVRASRTWGFGESGARGADAAAGGGGGRGGDGGRGGPPGGGGRGGPPGGGGGPGGGGPGGGGPGGFFGGGGATSGRYNLTLSVEARNLLNSVNPGSPVGSLSSPLFGQPQGVSGGFGGGGGGGSQSANRRLEIQLRFSF